MNYKNYNQMMEFQYQSFKFKIIQFKNYKLINSKLKIKRKNVVDRKFK